MGKKEWTRVFTAEQLLNPELDPYMTDWGCSAQDIEHLLYQNVPLDHATAVRGVLVDDVWYWGCGEVHEMMARDVGGGLQARYRRQWPLLPVIEFENRHDTSKGASCDIFLATRTLIYSTPITPNSLINIKTRVGTFLSVKDLFRSLGHIL